jgi:uncharacterized membrane protein YfcA
MMKNKLAKLIDVKSIITFALTAAFVYLAVTGQIEPQIFLTIYTMVISFYFGTQYQKHIKGGTEND